MSTLFIRDKTTGQLVPVPSLNGADAVSPTIEVTADTPDVYQLVITDKNGTKATPNLKGGKINDGMISISTTYSSTKIENELQSVSDTIIAQVNNDLNDKATKPEVNALVSRMDTFTSLPDGSTTGDAELIDGHVAGDGTVFSNIGSTIRSIGEAEKTIKRKALADDLFTEVVENYKRISSTSFYASVTSYNMIRLKSTVVLTSSVSISNVVATIHMRAKSPKLTVQALAMVTGGGLASGATSSVNGEQTLQLAIPVPAITGNTLSLFFALSTDLGINKIEFDLIDFSLEVEGSSVSTKSNLEFNLGTGTIVSVSNTYDSLIKEKSVFNSDLTPEYNIGFYVNKYGIAVASANYSWSKALKVRAGESISLTHIYFSDSVPILLLDEQKKLISYYFTGNASEDTNVTFTIPNNCSYIIFNKLTNRTVTVSYPTNKEYVNELPQFMFSRKFTDDYPIITFTDDDGFKEFDRFKGVLDANGVNATIAIVTANVGNDLKYTLVELQALKASGYDIVGHTNTHASSLYSSLDPEYANATEEDIYNDFLLCRQYLTKNGFNDECLIFPYGSYTGIEKKYISQAIKAGFQFSLNTVGGANAGDVINTFYLNRIFITDVKGIDYFKALIDDCVAQKSWLIFGAHGQIYDTSTDFYRQVVEYAKSKATILNFKEASAVRRNICSIGYYGDKSNRLYIGRHGQILNN